MRTGTVTVRDLFAASLIAADPTSFTARAIRLRLPAARPSAPRQTWIISMGKAAASMARAAVHEMAERNHPVAGGIIVAPTVSHVPHASIVAIAGDHPLPGRQSALAADALHDLCDRVRGDDLVFVLLSGGASSLVATPVDGVEHSDLVALCDTLLRSGLDIARVNAIRKRFLRWGAGRLATRLAPARVEQIVLSDVIGDNLAHIGSGPCTPDDCTATDVRRLIDETMLADQVPASLLRYLDGVMRGDHPETPKPDAPAFLFPGVPAVQGNGGVLDAGALRARVLGFEPVLIVNEPLAGEAQSAGARVAESALALPRGAVALWGGETTVTLGASHGNGGRCQELALAAALALRDAGNTADGISILAAGTDGRDGPTDAAGAIVDSFTVARIMEAGVDPRSSLARHDAYEALHLGGALLKTGMTGTNVGDVVIAVRT
ncbi:MAG: glycerate kinase type-2 family protein [Gemmatimonadaceae bacterium]